MGWAGRSGHIKKLKIGPRLAIATPFLDHVMIIQQARVYTLFDHESHISNHHFVNQCFDHDMIHHILNTHVSYLKF